jgi:membrane-associated protease RseP (regulator of RpoE activity)
MNDDGNAPHGDPDAAAHDEASTGTPRFDWRVPLLLFGLTLASTTYIGGLSYSIPLMLILLFHEFGHYLAARYHGVPASLPYFIPMPIFLLGTMGAVILMPERIRTKNALFDIGAAGPLSGMVVALPVLVYGILESPIQAQSTDPHLMEGYSLLYAGLLALLKGPIPEGQDIYLSATAFAGWVGLLVTMINLIPAAQLDGGHIAHALLGERHERWSRWFRWSLLPMSAGVALYYGLPLLSEGKSAAAIANAMGPGFTWIVWFALLYVIVRMTGREHPPTDPMPLSPGRRVLALLTLLLFALLFTPSWIRWVDPTL